MSISMADPTGLVDVYQAFDHGLCTRNKPFPSRNWCKPADRIDHMFGISLLHSARRAPMNLLSGASGCQGCRAIASTLPRAVYPGDRGEPISLPHGCPCLSGLQG
eukprot:2992457-Prymnesium_polylepis.2